MTQEKMDALLEIVEREQFESVVRAHAMLRDRCTTAMSLDERELAVVFQHLGGTLDPAVAAIELEARQFVSRAMELLKQVDSRLEELMAVVTTPPRTAHLGRSWLAEISQIDEMIETAELLMEAPQWQGLAAEAHLTTIPAQIEALRSLRSQARTAGESVIAVGALQNTIFEASAMLMVAAALQIDVQPPGEFVPAVLYRRTVGLVNILAVLVDALGQQFSGEGTWKESALELSQGLEDATSGIGFEWPKATKDDDHGRLGGGPGAAGGDDHPDEGHDHPGGDPGDDDDAGLGDYLDSDEHVEDPPADEEPGDKSPGDDEPGNEEPAPGDGSEDGEPLPDEETGAEEAPTDPEPEPVPDDEPTPDQAPEPFDPDPVPDPEPVPDPDPEPVPDPDPVPAPDPEPDPAPPLQPAPEPQPVPDPVPDPAPSQPQPAPEPPPLPQDPEQAAWEEEQSAATEEAWERIHRDRELAKDSLREQTLMP